jgi:hypothetical protein
VLAEVIIDPSLTFLLLGGFCFREVADMRRIPFPFSAGWKSSQPVLTRFLSNPITVPSLLLLCRASNKSITDTFLIRLPILVSETQVGPRISPVKLLTYARRYEVLAENITDPSHLPFAHHGVGGLRRKQGKPLPLTLKSKGVDGFTGVSDGYVFSDSLKSTVRCRFLFSLGVWNPQYAVSVDKCGTYTKF